MIEETESASSGIGSVRKIDDNVVEFRFRTEKASIEADEDVQSLGTLLIDAVRVPNSHVIVNFSGITYLSSAALGKLITARRKSDQQAGKLKLCNISSGGKGLMEIFEIARLEDYFDIHKDRMSALQACQSENTAADTVSALQKEVRSELEK